MLYEMAGLSLNWTLWDWAIRQRKVEEVRAVQRQLERGAFCSRIPGAVGNPQCTIRLGKCHTKGGGDAGRLTPGTADSHLGRSTLSAGKPATETEYSGCPG